MLASWCGRRARRCHVQPPNAGQRPTHMGCDTRDLFYSFKELFRPLQRAQGSWLTTWSGCLTLAHPCVLYPTPCPGSCISYKFYSFIYLVFLRQGLILYLRMSCSSLCGPGWHQTNDNPPASASNVLRVYIQASLSSFSAGSKSRHHSPNSKYKG